MTSTRAINNITAAILAIAPLFAGVALAGQAPGAASAPDIRISARDRVYLSDQPKDGSTS